MPMVAAFIKRVLRKETYATQWREHPVAVRCKGVMARTHPNVIKPLLTRKARALPRDLGQRIRFPNAPMRVPQP